MAERKGFVVTVVAAVIFGTMPFFAREIYAAGGNSVALCFYRFFFSIPLLLAIVRWGVRASIRVTRRQLWQIFLLSLGIVSTPMLLFRSYIYISSGMATTLHFVYPVLVLLGCALVFREKITPVQWMCCLLCVVGILCFYNPTQSEGTIGMILAFTSGIAYAFYVIYYSHSGLSALDPYVLALYLSIFSTLEVLLVACLTDQMVTQLPAYAWGLTVVFSFFISVVATVFFQVGAKLIGPQRVSILSTFEPLTSVIAGALFFHEEMTARSVLGIVCILAAVALLAMQKSKAAAHT